MRKDQRDKVCYTGHKAPKMCLECYIANIVLEICFIEHFPDCDEHSDLTDGAMGCMNMSI